jgi:hypothetical protein
LKALNQFLLKALHLKKQLGFALESISPVIQWQPFAKKSITSIIVFHQNIALIQAASFISLEHSNHVII